MNYLSGLHCISLVYLETDVLWSNLTAAGTKKKNLILVKTVQAVSSTVPLDTSFLELLQGYTTVLIVEDSSDLPCLLGNDFRYSKCLRASS